MMEKRSHSAPRSQASLWLRPGFALAVVLLPLFLGGGSEPVVEIIVVFAVGLLLLMFPARARLTGLWRFLLVALALWPLLALLPHGDFLQHSRWRDSLLSLAGYVPSPLIAPQSEVVLNTLPVYYAGLAFAVWGMQARWSPQERRFLAIAFGLAAGCLLVLAAARLWGGIRIPWWNPFTGLGPFVSRNQSGLFHAIGFIWCGNLAGDYFRERRRWIASFWLGLAGAFLAAAWLNGSRAGLGFCVAGLVLYLALVGLIYRRAVPLALAGFLFLGAFVALGYLRSNEAAFWRLDASMTPDSLEHSFRIKIQSDTWDLIREYPVTGVGLGDYDAVFPFYRVRSALDYRVHHAESDWLYFAAESGIPALAFAIAAVFLLMVPCWRRLTRDDFPANGPACFVVMLLALAHGFFDQSLHSPGIVFPVLLMASLLVPPLPEEERPPRPGFGLAMGMGLVALGVLSLGWLRQAQLARYELQGWRVDRLADIPLASVEEALAYAPLAWNLHELRGHLLLRMGRVGEALEEFRAARLLEPFARALVLRESNAWFDATRPALALEAAREVVLRAAPGTRGVFYGEYLERFAQFPDVQKTWLSFGSGETELQIVSLPYLPPQAAGESLERILSSHGRRVHLGAMAERNLIVFCLQKDGPGGLDVLDEAGFKFSPQAWISAARDLALAGNESTACALVVQELAPSENSIPLAYLEREYLASPDDWPRALRLVHAYLRRGSLLSAQRIMDRLPAQGEGMAQKNFYRAWLAYLQGDPAGAWALFQKCVSDPDDGTAIMR